MDKETYYKVVSDDEPFAVFETKEDALEYSENVREEGGRAYVREVKMTKEELEALPEM